jgi:hypothetical protein
MHTKNALIAREEYPALKRLIRGLPETYEQ